MHRLQPRWLVLASAAPVLHHTHCSIPLLPLPVTADIATAVPVQSSRASCTGSGGSSMIRSCLPLHARACHQSQSQAFSSPARFFSAAANARNTDPNPPQQQQQQPPPVREHVRAATPDLGNRPTRFIDFDASGKQLKSAMKRSELLQLYSLRPRDLRLVDGTLLNMKPQVLVRDNSIVFCMDHARAIITADRVLQMNFSGLWGHHLTGLLHRCLMNDRDSEDIGPSPYSPEFFTTSEDRNLIVHANVQNMQYWERIHDSAVVDETSDYELRALEALLISVTMNLDMSLHRLTASINSVLQELTDSVNSDSLQRLLPLKTSLNSFQVQVRETSSAIRAVLDDDEMMGSMRLTVKNILGEAFYPTEHHDHVERLFETYFHTIDEIQNEVQQLAANIKGSEEILSMAQDLSRNRIITLNLLASTGAFIVASGSLVASVFGMNVDMPSFLAHDLHFGLSPFAVICGGVLCTSSITALFCYRYINSHGRSASLNVKGYSILSQLLPYTDSIEEQMYKSGNFDQRLDFNAFSAIVSNATPKTYSRRDMESVFDLLDTNMSGSVAADRLLTILRGQQQSYTRHAQPMTVPRPTTSASDPF